MTIQEIKASARAFLTADDICPSIVPITARAFKRQILYGNVDFGFPVTRIGKRIMIPREPFLRYVEEGRNDEKDKRR